MRHKPSKRGHAEDDKASDVVTDEIGTDLIVRKAKASSLKGRSRYSSRQLHALVGMAQASKWKLMGISIYT